jgi:hypothetical protein
MLRALGISLLLLAGSAGSAAADNMCGDEPIAPAIASPEADNRKIGETQRGDKPDPDKIKKIQADIASLSQAYGNSTDDEERVVNEFNALSVAYCTRGDVDKASCPKR